MLPVPDKAPPSEVTLACGHVAADLPATALLDVLALARDVQAGTVKADSSVSTDSAVASFERDSFSIVVRRDDAALQGGRV